MLYKDARQVYRVSEFDSYSWLDHGFGTRLSGAWVPGPLTTLRQIHSDICVTADGREGCLGEGDALLSRTPGHYIGVRTADCLPILLLDPRLRVVAAIHAGWRGTATGIAATAVREMEGRFGSRPAGLAAAIGPGICGKCYLVGPEVAARFRTWFPERHDLDRETTVDLAEACRRQLVQAGLDPARIYTGAPCTLTSPEQFYSHRGAQGKTGRMLSAIALRL